MAWIPRVDEYREYYCNKGLGPVAVSGLLISILEDFFYYDENIQEPNLKDRTWTSSLNTEILITSVGNWKPELAGKRPAILVKRGAWRTEFPGLHQGLIQGSYPDSHTYLVLGTHYIIIIGKTYAETETLAEEVYRFLLNVSPIILEELPFHLFRVREIGEVRPLKEDRTHFMTIVSVDYAFIENWNIYRETTTIPP